MKFFLFMTTLKALFLLTSCYVQVDQNGDWTVALNTSGAIFGPDSRVMVGNEQGEGHAHLYPYSAIVRVEQGISGDYCTGFLVGERVVVTNAHCVDQAFEEGQLVSPGSVRIYANYRSEGFTRSSWAVDIEVGTHIPGRDYVYRDWAVIELRDSLGREFGHMHPLRSLPNNHFWSEGLTLAGYSFDLYQGRTLTADRACSIRGELSFSGDFDGLKHDCATAAGASGSPIFKCLNKRNGEMHCIVVAIHVSGMAFGHYYDYFGQNGARNMAAPISMFTDIIDRFNQRN